MFSIYAGVTVAALFAQSPPPDIDQFLERFGGERGGMNSFVADFAQESITPDEITQSHGQLIYARPQRIRFRYSDIPLDFLLHGLRIYEYDPEFEQMDIVDLEDRPETEALYMGFESNPERLREAYEIELRPRADGKPGTILKLKPKVEPDQEPLFESVTLTLRARDFLPTYIVIQNDADSSVHYTLTNHTLNPELTEDDLTIVLPEETVIVENGTYIETVGEEGKRFPQLLEVPDGETGEAEHATQAEDLP